jgi:transcriptional regulator with XRE-family HTH domain
MLRVLRCKRRITAQQLRKAMRVGVSTVARWENGTAFPSVLQAQEVARVLKCAVSDLWSTHDVVWSKQHEGYSIQVLKVRRKINNGRRGN